MSDVTRVATLEEWRQACFDEQAKTEHLEQRIAALEEQKERLETVIAGFAWNNYAPAMKWCDDNGVTIKAATA